ASNCLRGDAGVELCSGEVETRAIHEITALVREAGRRLCNTLRGGVKQRVEMEWCLGFLISGACELGGVSTLYRHRWLQQGRRLQGWRCQYAVSNCRLVHVQRESAW
ncbi:unnamed protein product, partial [Ectocarpus sp. 13 AM-2016]